MAAYTPPPLGPYQYHEVISALRKEIKLDRPEQAIYWLNVLLKYGGKPAPKTAAKQLWIMAAEDCMDQAVTMRAFAVFQMADAVPETDQLVFLTYQMCKAPKWWESAEGLEVDRLWSMAEGRINRGEVVPVPEYAKDRHTRAGWALLKERGYWDDRFSGTEVGRAKTRYLFARDGELNPEQELDEDFIEVFNERAQLAAMGKEEIQFGLGLVAGRVVKPKRAVYDETDQGELPLGE